jgi:D-3-phosphoglycerate dehydrogenase / 2-oxoglutarate reductase
MKVLVADSFEQSGIDGLTALGYAVVYNPDLSGDALAEVLRGESPDVLVVRGTRVTESMMSGTTLSLIVRAGAGLNTIDIEAARRLGIAVANCPGLNAIAVAELTIGLLLALDRRLPEQVAELRAGRWNKREFSQARGLYGRVLGLLGYGRIAQEVARRAGAFGMRVMVWSRRLAASSVDTAVSESGVTVVDSPVELARRSDAFSVHMALTPETHGFVGQHILEGLKPGALFVNTARAELVDSAALTEAARRGVRVALDVFADEPAATAATFRDPMLELPGVIGTHHVGGSTEQAQQAIAQEVVRIIRDWSRHEHHNPHS